MSSAIGLAIELAMCSAILLHQETHGGTLLVSVTLPGYIVLACLYLVLAYECTSLLHMFSYTCTLFPEEMLY